MTTCHVSPLFVDHWCLKTTSLTVQTILCLNFHQQIDITFPLDFGKISPPPPPPMNHDFWVGPNCKWCLFIDIFLRWQHTGGRDPQAVDRLCEGGLHWCRQLWHHLPSRSRCQYQGHVTRCCLSHCKYTTPLCANSLRIMLYGSV